MVELKTLKDFDRQVENANDHLSRSRLRQEIIRWIKAIRAESDKVGRNNSFPKDIKIDGLELEVWAENSEDYGAITVLMHIFNITEKDL